MQYEIMGGSFPLVMFSLENGESIRTENGAMLWRSPNMDMETTGGGFGKMLSKALSGETLFQNIYTARGGAKIALGCSYPGEIKALEIGPGKEYIIEKGSFLACTEGVNLDMHLNKKLGTGLFGGEGFIMQRLSGNGLAFLEIDGALMEYELRAGQEILVSTGNIAAFSAEVKMEIQKVSGIKNVLLSREGFFNTKLTGPGRIYLQTMSIARLATELIPYLPTSSPSSSN